MASESTRKEPREKVPQENERLARFRSNLALNLLVQAPFPAQASNTFWEELTCIGYNPLLSQLEGVISIKQATGYSGNLCSTGSMEFVRFFVDWGDGAGYQDVGLTSLKSTIFRMRRPARSTRWSIWCSCHWKTGRTATAVIRRRCRKCAGCYHTTCRPRSTPTTCPISATAWM